MMLRLANNRLWVWGLLAVYGLWGNPVQAQKAWSTLDRERLAQAEAMLGTLTVLGNPAMTLSTPADYQNGVTVNHTTLRISVPLGVLWTLEVRALDDLRNGAYSIPISAVGVRVTNLAGAKPEVMLSTQSQTLASGLANLLLSTNLILQYRATGGAAFLKPGGAYTSTLVFTLTGL